MDLNLLKKGIFLGHRRFWIADKETSTNKILFKI